MRSRYCVTLGIVSNLLAGLSCGGSDGDTSESSASATSHSDTTIGHDASTESSETASTTDAPELGCITEAKPRGPSVVYLAFDGIKLDPTADGDDDATARRSSLIAQTTTYASFWADEVERSEKIAAVVTDLETIFAGFEVEVTTTPPVGDHILVVLAGDDAGDLHGLARHDCGDVVRNDVIIFFAGVANPERGEHAVANEVAFALTRSIGLAKTRGPGHPCSCDPTGLCSSDSLCELQPEAEVTFSSCPGLGTVIDELEAFSQVFGCVAS